MRSDLGILISFQYFATPNPEPRDNSIPCDIDEIDVVTFYESAVPEWWVDFQYVCFYPVAPSLKPRHGICRRNPLVTFVELPQASFGTLSGSLEGLEYFTTLDGESVFSLEAPLKLSLKRQGNEASLYFKDTKILDLGTNFRLGEELTKLAYMVDNKDYGDMDLHLLPLQNNLFLLLKVQDVQDLKYPHDTETLFETLLGSEYKFLMNNQLWTFKRNDVMETKLQELTSLPSNVILQDSEELDCCKDVYLCDMDLNQSFNFFKPIVLEGTMCTPNRPPPPRVETPVKRPVRRQGLSLV